MRTTSKLCQWLALSKSNSSRHKQQVISLVTPSRRSSSILRTNWSSKMIGTRKRRTRHHLTPIESYSKTTQASMLQKTSIHACTVYTVPITDQSNEQSPSTTLDSHTSLKFRSFSTWTIQFRATDSLMCNWFRYKSWTSERSRSWQSSISATWTSNCSWDYRSLMQLSTKYLAQSTSPKRFRFHPMQTRSKQSGRTSSYPVWTLLWTPSTSRSKASWSCSSGHVAQSKTSPTMRCSSAKSTSRWRSCLETKAWTSCSLTSRSACQTWKSEKDRWRSSTRVCDIVEIAMI